MTRLHAAHGIESLIVSKPHRAFEERATREGVDIVAAPISGKLNPRAIPTIQAMILRFRPDLVCTHLSSASYSGTIAARRSGVPCVAIVHGFNSILWYRGAERMVCVSQAVADHMKRLGIPGSRLTVIHNGIDPAGFDSAVPAALPIPDGAFCIGTIAHLTHKKGLLELVEAAMLLPDCHFVLAGEGKLRRALESASKNRLGGRLHLLGYREDVPSLMKRFDLFCLPSHREPFGLVLLEAMAAGKPVVAFRSGGAPEIVEHGVSGLLAEPGNIRALAACIERFRDDRELRERAGRQGRQRVIASFDLESTASRWAELFERAIAEHRSSRAMAPALRSESVSTRNQ